MNGYTKLFGSILDSTIWQEDLATKVLWITMLAMVNRDGTVKASIPGLAKRAHISLAECEASLAKLQAPDIYSQSKAEEGRRVKAVDGGWFLINYEVYRHLMSAEEQREKTRLRVEKFRASRKRYTPLPTVTVTESNECNDIATATAAVTGKEEKKAFSPFESKGQTPTDQPALNLARGMAERLGLVVTKSLLIDLEAAIKCAAARISGNVAQGYDHLLALARKAREHGIPINQFWFRDADKWDDNGHDRMANQAALGCGNYDTSGNKAIVDAIKQGKAW